MLDVVHINVVFVFKVIMIKKPLPIMSVCSYHKLGHIWEVPLFIKRLNPDNRLFLR